MAPAMSSHWRRGTVKSAEPHSEPYRAHRPALEAALTNTGAATLMSEVGGAPAASVYWFWGGRGVNW